MLKATMIGLYPVLLASAVSLALLVVGCSQAPTESLGAEQANGATGDVASALLPAELLLELPDNCNTPDALCLLPDGNIILSVPNVNDKSQPSVLMKITPDNTAEMFYTMPPHPETDKAYSLGVCVAPSGDLYVSDNQEFDTLETKSDRKSFSPRLTS
jgi:hypothetical protein